MRKSLQSDTTKPKGIKMTLTSKKCFQKIILIYVNLCLFMINNFSDLDLEA
jgi:hypothetical protein